MDQIIIIIFIAFVAIFIIICDAIFVEKRDREINEVLQTSEKIKEIKKLNEQCNFNIIYKTLHELKEREYSRKSFDRLSLDTVIKYYIEINNDFLRDDIENSIFNNQLFEYYYKKVKNIEDSNINTVINIPVKKYLYYENKIFTDLIFDKNNYITNVKLTAFYKSNGGNVYDSKYRTYSFNELVTFYQQWKNGNKYEESKKIERKIMNDDIRYNVLKRDNFRCKICGISAADGAKLHVDHIIPVSKGGKTVMSNLQTLCDRCNIGKSDKLNSDNNFCPICGGTLVLRKGKYNKFYGCSNYPICHYIRK